MWMVLKEKPIELRWVVRAVVWGSADETDMKRAVR